LGEIQILHPYPALRVEERNSNYIVITDLHIGFEHRFNKDGFRIAISIEKLLNTTLDIIKKWKPKRLLILGDIKSGFGRINREEWRYIPKYLEEISSSVEISIIPGNHDGSLKHLLPSNVMLESNELVVNNIGFLHGHAQPSKQLLKVKRLVIGHIHPTYSRIGNPLSGRQIWLILRVKKKLIFNTASDKEMLEIWVMPSFNSELSASGFIVNRKRIISPILRKVNDKISDALIFTLDGSVIGDVDSIQYVL
jgi:putative SbcD/Mre11-related phosphoesterase